jgi:ribonuclease HI
VDECEPLTAGLSKAAELGISKLKVKGDSKLVINQVGPA